MQNIIKEGGHVDDQLYLIVSGEMAQEIRDELGDGELEGKSVEEIEARLNLIRNEAAECLERFPSFDAELQCEDESAFSEDDFENIDSTMEDMLSELTCFVTTIETLKQEHEKCLQALAKTR